MDKTERLQAHAVQGSWMPNPQAHLNSPRDAFHFFYTLALLRDLPGASILDVGSYDGWLDFLLLDQGYKVEGVEAIPELCASARSYASGYVVHQGFFDEVKIDKHFDVALCFETLEHIPLDAVPAYVAKMEAIATRRILISLPDQRHEDNAQHLWSPSMDLIQSMWGNKKGFSVTYKTYPGTDVPPNFFIRWDK